MAQRLTRMAIDKVSLVDRGANGRPIALLKRAPAVIRKDVPTFASLQANAAIAQWLPNAIATLGTVIDAALNPGIAAEGVAPEIRLRAVTNSVDEFKAQLVERVAAAIVSQAPAEVAKRRSTWAGTL